MHGIGNEYITNTQTHIRKLECCKVKENQSKASCAFYIVIADESFRYYLYSHFSFHSFEISWFLLAFIKCQQKKEQKPNSKSNSSNRTSFTIHNHQAIKSKLKLTRLPISPFDLMQVLLNLNRLTRNWVSQYSICFNLSPNEINKDGDDNNSNNTDNTHKQFYQIAWEKSDFHCNCSLFSIRTLTH